MDELHIRTERLLLRRWRLLDRELFAHLNSDPLVMEHFPGVLSREESDAMVDRIETQFDEVGFGLWAIEAPDLAPFIGFVGLSVPNFQAHFTPAVEVGWRLDRSYWGHGFATEAANAALVDGFGRVGLSEIVSFTATENVKSIRVMERLGMTHDLADDFEHPRLPEGHRLRRHVLYRLSQERWATLTVGGAFSTQPDDRQELGYLDSRVRRPAPP
jgi:RimJ/RimL family protein N-acetyltransferase